MVGHIPHKDRIPVQFWISVPVFNVKGKLMFDFLLRWKETPQQSLERRINAAKIRLAAIEGRLEGLVASGRMSYSISADKEYIDLCSEKRAIIMEINLLKEELDKSTQCAS